jgi:S1-C subfamily serine protease
MGIGDVIIAANRRSFESAADLTDAIADTGRGALKLRFLRGDRTRVREVTVSLNGPASREAA